MVDAVVGVFLDKLINALASERRKVIEFRDEFENMKSQLYLLQSFLKDAEKSKRKDHIVRALVDGLRELIHDAEDILADCQLQASKQKQTSDKWLVYVSPLELAFRMKTGNRLRDINRKIASIKDDMRTYLTSTLVTSTNSEEANGNVERWSSSFFDMTQIVGLEDDANKIKRWLFQARDGLTAIGIVGMGGLGKTTAAQKIFNDRQVEDHFEKRVWVSVSQKFKEEDIMRIILKNLGDASIGTDRGELLRKIHQYLSGKSYLIVFDDVWSVDNGWWSRLSDGLPKGNGSSVIITTRNRQVATKMGVVDQRIHQPKVLTMEEGWSLFCKIAFAGSGGRHIDTRLETIGREIVEKCDGLPLAIKAVGGIMVCKSSISEWRRIADNFNEELSKNTDLVMVSLQLSYDELPSYLKPCFLCFSIFPEDCVMLKDQLIRWWIGEGFVPSKNGKLAVDTGEDCFLGLMNRCLVEVVDMSYNGRVYTCKIHDMVRDLVMQMAKEEAFCVLKDGCCRRLSLTSYIEENNINKVDLRLRALVSTASMNEVNKISPDVFEMLSKSRNLRVLDISESIMEAHDKDLLSDVGSIPHLACLTLRNVHPLTQVPPSIKKLGNLRILDLSFCHNLKRLPSCITILENLIVLDMSCCGSLQCMPRGLGKLSNLQVLLGFKPSSPSCQDGCCLAELRSLSMLKTLELRITQAEEIADDELNALQDLEGLQHLIINCFNSYGPDLVEKLNRLSLPRRLHELSLKFFPGDRSPAWLNPMSLAELDYLSISNGNLSQMHPSFWGAERFTWGLQGLMLESLAELEVEWEKVHQAMPSLRMLCVRWCPNLETFPLDDVGFKGGMWRKEE
ncbi:Disease resistance RPP13-like protein 4 [Acorus gramineus]|uniref:Disease resistance RPP13-like protein 4 n=1 Tax=Acorus gramineus TaxID=55184 RepID=A0AAV9A6H9_ACOGR|nr:Disease resistance RPP13-like protein 4 [Acorus gramineus]